MQAGAAGRNGPLPQERASFARLEVQARYQAGSARRAFGRAHVGLWIAAPREAEAAPDLRRAGAAVRALLRRSDQRHKLDRHEPAADSLVTSRQRRLSNRPGLDD